MRKVVPLISLAFLTVGLPARAEDEAGKPAPAKEAVSYYRDIRPLFQQHCQGCHQPAQARGSYVMTAHADLLKPGDTDIPGVVPGQPDKSLIVAQIKPQGGKPPAMPKERPPLTPEQRAKTPPVEQRMVRTHPVTGKKALYVNPGFTKGIVGMPREESQPILQMLFAHATRPEFIYRHKWRVNDLVFWDNRCTMHYALADYDFSVRRHMHRTTIAGDAPY